jgi:cell wall-associated NlpC family hydrolase
MALSNEQREHLAKEAKEWIGTPYRGWSCLKNIGCDCGMFIYGVYRACGLIPEIDIDRTYSIQAPLHQDRQEFEGRFHRYFREVQELELQPGDIVLYRLGLGYNHAAIVLEWPSYIAHAEARHGVCGGHGIKEPTIRGRDRMYFTLRDEFCDPAANALLRNEKIEVEKPQLPHAPIVAAASTLTLRRRTITSRPKQR